MAVHVRPEARQPGDDLGLGRVGGPRLLLERVLGDVDVDRTRPAAPGDVERLGDDPRQVVRVADEVVVLGHRQRDAVDVDLLEGVLADQRRRHVAGDRDHRDRIEERGPDTGDEVRRARTGRAHADADPPGDPGIAVGGVGAALLVPDEDVPQLGIVAEDVVERQDHAARVAEDDVDALEEQRLAQDVRTDPRPLEVATFVEHALARALDRCRFGAAVVRHVAPPGGRERPGACRCRLRGISLGDRHLAGPPVAVSWTDGAENEKPSPPRRGS